MGIRAEDERNWYNLVLKPITSLLERVVYDQSLESMAPSNESELH